MFDSSPVPRGSAMVGACFPVPNRRSTLGFLGKAQTNKKPNQKPPQPLNKNNDKKKYPPNQTQSNSTKTPTTWKKHMQKEFGWMDGNTWVVLSVRLASHIRSRNCCCFFGSWGSGLLPYSEHVSFDSTRKVRICQTNFAGKGQL